MGSVDVDGDWEGCEGGVLGTPEAGTQALENVEGGVEELEEEELLDVLEESEDPNGDEYEGYDA